MISKMTASGGQFTLGIVLLIAILTLLLMATQSYFNSSEINSLVEQAEENNLEYEVVIHNQLTNSYSFTVPTNSKK